MSQMEYRFEFLAWTIVNILWFVLLIVMVELLFGQVSTVSGWTKHEVLIVASLSGMFNSLMWMFIIPSLWTLSENVRKGSLDFYLTKPVNSRLLISVHLYDLDNITRMFFMILYILFGVGLINTLPTFSNFLGFLISFGLGLAIFYNIFFILAASTIWFTDLFNLDDVYANLLNVGRFPTDIFKGGLNIFFTFVVPAVFIATIPAKFLLGRGSWWDILLAWNLTLVSFILSQRFWKFALKHYSSASS